MSNWFRTYGFAEVADDLVIGAYPTDAGDVAMLKSSGIQRVLNLVEDAEYRAGQREEVTQALAESSIDEERLRLTDYGGLPPQIVEQAVHEVNRWLDNGTRTYIHCRAGWQRSAAIAAAVIAVRQGLELDDALESIQLRKPTADPLPHQREDLRRWWEWRTRAVAGETAASAD